MYGQDCCTAREAGLSQRRPIRRLAAYTVFCELVTAWRFAMCPTSRLLLSEIATIDGAGGVLGQAGPIFYRTDSLLPANGTMQFDVADSEDFDDIGMFNDIVFHEMCHVLGFGTLWEAMGLVQENADGTLNFLGENALTAYAAEGGGNTPIQIETDGGSGTAGGHWDDELYDNEIMTGYINTEGNYLSNTTIAALEDMGYDTVFDPTDPLAATSGLDLTIFNDHIV